MLPSELLRKEIEEKYNVDLEQYTWPEQFRNLVFSILLDENLEENARTLKEIYEKGFNIGHCGLTSRYISRKFDEAKMYQLASFIEKELNLDLNPKGGNNND